MLLNGRVENLEYGSCAPGAPRVFIDDADFKKLWLAPGRYYLATYDSQLPRLERLVGLNNLHVMVRSGGQLLLSNQASGTG